MEVGVLAMAIHVFYGTDAYRKERAFKALRQKLVNTDLGGLTHHVLEKPRLSQVLETLNTSFFALGGLPVVELHHWEGLYDPSEEDKRLIPELMDTLALQSEQKDILFMTPKLDVRLKLGKWLKSHAQCYVYDVPPFYKPEEAVHLLLEECKHLGIALTMEAATLLVEHVGHDLRPLVNECEKLHAFTNAQRIDVHHVTRFSVLDAQTFSLVDAWLQQRLTHRSIHDLNALLVREAPVKFLALLLSRVEYYYRLKQGLAVGQSLDALSQAEGKKTYPVQKDLQKMRGLTLERLSQLKHLLLKTERALKSGTQQPVLALEQLFLG